jgi:hypothetical protein
MFVKFHAAGGSARAKNAAHIKYIGKRPGVDKQTQDDQGDEIYFRYLNERPRSHGLFTQMEGEPDMDSVVQEIRGHNGIVWRSILSLREDDAVRYGYTNRRKWEETLRATLPELAYKMGIKTEDFRWFAAFHKEEGHPHVHIVFWDKGNKRQRGKLSPSELEHARHLFMREIYGEHRKALLAEKTVIRDSMRRAAIELTKAEHVWLNNSLLQLSLSLPKTGKKTLAYMPAAVKRDAMLIAEEILDHPSLSEQTGLYAEIAAQLAMHHTRQSEAIETAVKNAKDDLCARVAQVVLKAAYDCRNVRNRATPMQTLVFPQVWSLLQKETQRLERARFWAGLREAPRAKQEGKQHVEINKQKEVERA